MEIEQRRQQNNGAFFVQTDGKMVAEMTYSLHYPSVMAIEHTEVDPSLRGKNIGLQLLKKAVAYARERELKIRPLCPYVKAVFEKHPEEYQEIIYK